MQALEEAQIQEMFEKFKKIYYDNERHPLGRIRFCLYLFMNGHDQETYQKLSGAQQNNSSQNQAADIGTDIATEIYINGPIGPYQNRMANDYLTYLNNHDKQYFDRFKKMCHMDKDFPADKESFDNYASSISDYSIGRDYIRGGKNRRWQDEFKAECWKWFDDHHKEKYNKDPESVNHSTLLTLILCHLISRINILAKENQQIVDKMNLKFTFRKNVGTPKVSFLTSELFTARGKRSYLVPISNDDTNHPIELSADEALSQISCIILAFVGDFLNREDFYLYKNQSNLPVVRLDNTAILDSFWLDEEDVESLLLKLNQVLDKMIADTTLSAEETSNLEKFQKQVKSHNIYYNQSRYVFTELYKKMSPQDFYSPQEIEDTFQILNSINNIITELTHKNPQKITLSKQTFDDLTLLSNQIEKHIEYHTNPNRAINVAYKQFALRPYQKISHFIRSLINLCKEIMPIIDIAKALVGLNINYFNPTNIFDNLLNMLSEHLTVEELNEVIFTFLIISKEEFNDKLIKLCVADLIVRQLTPILKKYCKNTGISVELFDKKAGDIMDSSLSDDNKKEQLKQLCQPEFKADEIENLIMCNILHELPVKDLKFEILKLGKNLTALQEKKPYASSAPIAISKTHSGETQPKKGSKVVSGYLIPVLPIANLHQNDKAPPLVPAALANPEISSLIPGQQALATSSSSSTPVMSSQLKSTTASQPSNNPSLPLTSSTASSAEPGVSTKTVLNAANADKPLVDKQSTPINKEKKEGIFPSFLSSLFGSNKQEKDKASKPTKEKEQANKQNASGKNEPAMK